MEMEYKFIIESLQRIEANIERLNHKLEKIGVKPPVKRSDPEKGRTVRELYVAGYVKRWGIEPVWAAKENKLAHDLVKKVGLTEAVTIAARYPFYNDPWHVKQKHPFGLLITQLDKIRVEISNPDAMLTHRKIGKEMSEAFKESFEKHSQAQVQELAKGCSKCDGRGLLYSDDKSKTFPCSCEKGRLISRSIEE